MAYGRDDIERVRAATDLVQLIEEVTTVRRVGRTVTAICPFHQEKTPSLSIDQARGLYHCFGCQCGGDVFRFVQETQGIDFGEAVELLARRAGIALRHDPQAARRTGERERLVEAVEEAATFYHEVLRSDPEAGKARAYLRSRDYTSETAEAFRLGYSPGRWDALTSHLRAKRFSEQVVVAAGLGVRSRQGRLVDRFRGRVMFPIHDLRGDPVGFGARQLEGEGPKYLNSPETRLYAKSRLLYGLDRAKAAIVREGRAVVVEGYTDVIACHQAGLPAVATCGTALAESHLDLLRRFTERVVLAFDADQAGTGATIRGFERSVPGELDLRVAALPQGRDPADLVQAGELDALRKAVESSAPLLQFRLEQELERFDLEEPEARARAVRATAPLVARHPDPLVRGQYAGFLARRTGVEQAAVRRVVERSAADLRATPTTAPVPPPPTGQERAEREMLRLLLANHPGLRDLGLTADVFTVDEHRAAFDLLAPAVASLEPGEPPDLGSLLGQNHSEVGGLLRALALDPRPLDLPEEVYGRLSGWAIDRRIAELRRELEMLDPDRDAETYSARFAELLGLEAAKRNGGIRK